MKIGQNYNVQQPKFGNSQTFAHLTKKIPDAKVLKNMTYLDKNCLITYLYSIPFRMKTTQEEIKNIFQLNGEDFVSSAYKFIANKMGIPEAVCPTLINVPDENLQAPLKFLPNQNIIVRFSNANNLPKVKQFAHLRHELQHAMQNFYIFRHETIGKEAVEVFANNKVKELKNALRLLLESNVSVEDFIRQAGKDEFAIFCYTHLKEKQDRDGSVDIDAEFEGVSEAFKPIFENHRDTIIKAMGEIKEGTPAARKAEAFFAENINLNYYDAEGNIDFGQYITSTIETDASIAEQVVEFDLEGGGCFFKKLKDNSLALLAHQNSAEFKSLEKAVQEKIADYKA